jgi:hypothetical protein
MLCRVCAAISCAANRSCPDFSKMKPNVDYVYFNKAMGVRHWMEHVLGYPKDPVDDDAILVLMDPDQLVVRNFTDD